MRIFIISRGYPTPRYPQWGCFEYDQALALKELEHEVVMLSVDTRFRFSWRKIGVAERCENGIYGFDCFIRPSATYLGMIRKRISQYLQLKHVYHMAVKRFGRPDIFYSHYLTTSYLAVRLSKATGIPIVGIEHWSELNRRPLPLQVRIMGRYTYPKLDQLISVSSSLQRTIKQDFGVDSQVVANVYNPIFHFQHLPTNHATLNIVTTGSLLPIKGFNTLIRALALVNESYTDWHLSIIGEGKEKMELLLLAQQLGIANKITFEGKKNKDAIANIYQDAHLYICSSLSETFGVAILEALACGIPAITTNCGGPEDFITPDNGVIVPVQDVPQMAAAIEQFSAHRDKYDRAAIAADCDARFSPRVIAQQLTEIFEQTIANSKL